MIPELATRDGSPPPDLPRGECILTRLDDGSLRIDQADPRILVSAEVLDAIVNGDASPYGSLYWPHASTGSRRYTGAIVKIAGVNRTVVYRITEYVPFRSRLHR